MRHRFLMIIGTFALFIAPNFAHAAPTSITFGWKHHLYTIALSRHPEWRTPEEAWYFHGHRAEPTFCNGDCQNAQLDPEQRAKDSTVDIPEGWTKGSDAQWNRDAIKATIQTTIADNFHREAQNVTISRSSGGTIMFTGSGMIGRSINVELTTDLALAAIENNINHVALPVTEVQPVITVTDPELQAKGIKEIVTIGESDYTGSTNTRIHNVKTGLKRFNGTLIEKDAIFSFVEILGPVDAAAGYLRELVIKGDRTVPDYGGGLCQVSSTAYRGVWEYGFPITQRKNHSYTVSYYGPQGTDATVYPPSVDIKFKNDSPGALLIQTIIDTAHRKAYFVYYGTKDERKSEVFGPYIWGTSAPPPDKFEYTTDLPVGEKKKMGERVSGMSVSWYRSVADDANADPTVQETYSAYQARPLFYQVGVASLDDVPGATGSGSSSIPN